MAKVALAQTFVRAVVTGRRYSRSPTDTTAPSDPTLLTPVTNTTFIDLAWVNGIDAETGIQETRVEYRVHDAADWIEFSRVPYPVSLERITGLALGTSYDVGITNYDNAGNASARVVRTVSTLGTSADLEPGTIAIGIPSITVQEGQLVGISVTRTGGGASSPAVEADWSFTGFSEGAPSPENGTLAWAAGENSAQTLEEVTAGAVTADRLGAFQILAVRALSGTIQPTLGLSSISVTIQNVTATFGKKWHPGHYVRADGNTGATITAADLTAIGQANVKGAEIQYAWAEIESTRGNYQIGFDRIDGHLSQIGATKRLILHIKDRSFAGTNGNGLVVPAYLATEPGGDGGWFQKTTLNSQGQTVAAGIIAKVWLAAVNNRRIAMLKALAARYDTHPQVEIILAINESSPGAGVNNVDPTFTRRKYVDEMKRCATEVAAAWPHTTVLARSNFLDGFIPELLAHYNSVGVGHGGPDVPPPPHANTDAGEEWIANYLDTVACGYVAASTPYTDTNAKDTKPGGVGYTATEMWNMANGTLRCTHISWVRREAGSAPWTTGILPVINANPSTVASCPSQYAACNTG